MDSVLKVHVITHTYNTSSTSDKFSDAKYGFQKKGHDKLPRISYLKIAMSMTINTIADVGTNRIAWPTIWIILPGKL